MPDAVSASGSDNNKQNSVGAVKRSRSVGIGPFYLTDVFQLFAVIAIVVLACVFPSFHFRGTGMTSAPVTSVLASIFWFAVICGLASMATVEAAKRLAGLRGLYQRNQVVRWLDDRSGTPATADAALAELDQALGRPPMAGNSRPARSGDDSRKRRALYDLPIGQLVAQVGIAADLALTDTSRYQSLLSVLTGEASPTAKKGDERVRQSQLLRTALDQLQISVGDRWRRYVQGTALWLSGAYGLALGYLLDMPGRSVYVIAGLFIGGFFAWLARDLAGGVERWRRQ